MKYELPNLPYDFDGLEPYIDAQTMELHYTKHHQSYVDHLNKALEEHPEVSEKPLDDILHHIDQVPEEIRTAVRNHGGGHANHSFFWTIMSTQKEGGGGEPTDKLEKTLSETFGSSKKFREEFTKAAAGVFGSGWAWLVRAANGKLFVTTTPNQDSPIMNGAWPILGLDVWEHAYYLKHQNRRAEYIDAWWNVVNWKEVEKYSILTALQVGDE